MNDFIIKPEEVQKYSVPIEVSGGGLRSAIRFSDEFGRIPPLGSIKKARLRPTGGGAATAKAVPNWEERELQSRTGAIHASICFPVQRPRSIRRVPPSNRMVAIACQQVADQLRMCMALAAFYNSEPMYAARSTGYRRLAAQRSAC
jgi:hypothetical protein